MAGVAAAIILYINTVPLWCYSWESRMYSNDHQALNSAGNGYNCIHTYARMLTFCVTGIIYNIINMAYTFIKSTNMIYHNCVYQGAVYNINQICQESRTSSRTVVSDGRDDSTKWLTGLLFFVSAVLLSTFILLFLLCSPVSLSYFNLAVPMRKCLGKHSCMSSTFSRVILNGTCSLRAPILFCGDVLALKN